MDYLLLLIIVVVCFWNIVVIELVFCEFWFKKYLVLIDIVVINFYLWILLKNKDGKVMYVLYMINMIVIGEYKII